MEDRNESIDRWSLPLLFLWACFFVAGLYPSIVFYYLRELGEVATQRAIVNSPHVITIALALYLGLFAFQRSVEAGLTRAEAELRGLFVTTLGFVAFLDFPFEFLINMPDLIARGDRHMLYVAAPAKLTAWLYLYIAILRYYAIGNSRVFADILRVAARETPSETSGEKPQSNDAVPRLSETAEPGCDRSEGHADGQ